MNLISPKLQQTADVSANTIVNKNASLTLSITTSYHAAKIGAFKIYA